MGARSRAVGWAAAAVLFAACINRVGYDVAAEPCLSVGPPDCPSVGLACDDGSVFAGQHPTAHATLFLHPSQPGGRAWSLVSEDSGATSFTDGSANQRAIESRPNAADYPAFAECTSLNQTDALGHDDWYLPAQLECVDRQLIDRHRGASADGSTQAPTKTPSRNARTSALRASRSSS